MTWLNGRYEHLRKWLRISIVIATAVVTVIGVIIESRFQAAQNARDIERLEREIEATRNALWSHPAYRGDME